SLFALAATMLRWDEINSIKKTCFNEDEEMSKQTEVVNKSKILVVDDDSSVLEVTEFHLKSEGYEVTTTESGEEGARLAMQGLFDLVLTDLQLPDLDGLEILKRLKESRPDLPVIMISGYGSDRKAHEATREGAFYFIQKPIKYDELLLLIGKGLE